MSTVNSLWQLYLFFGVCSGIGVSGADVMPLSTVARWFVKKRGMMSGILKVGTGVGQMTIPLLATSLILAYGWRQSFIYLGVIGLIVLIVVAQFLKRDPAEKGLLPYGAEADEGSEGSREEYGLSLKEALQTGRFRMYCAICVLFYFLMQIIMAHTVLNAIGLGISALSAATLLSTIGGASIGGRLTMGVILDKIGSRLSLIICFIILVLSMVWLQTATELWSLYVFAGMYGFAHGGFFALFSPLVAELFGLKAHGSILGAVIFSGAAGGAAGPVLAGWIFDVTQSYQIAFLLCLALSVAALILSVLLKRANAGKGADFVIG
jgi:MFS family permease